MPRRNKTNKTKQYNKKKTKALKKDMVPKNARNADIL